MSIKNTADDNISKEMENAAKKINNKRSTDTVTASSKENINATRRRIFSRYVSATETAISEDGKVYLKAEAWLYLASLFNLNVNVSVVDLSAEPYAVMVDVKLTDKNGNVVSSGAMSASKSETWLSDKPDYAVIGLAQTRAISRAIRNKYGWFVRLCGYESTPSEEIK